MENESRSVMSKLGSRKLWMCIAAFCGSIATSIAALNSGYEIVAGIGVGCGIIAGAASAVVYTITEGSVDRAAIESTQTVNTTNKTVTASTESTTTANKIIGS